MLRENEEIARLSKHLATMALDLPLDVDVEELAAVLPQADEQAALRIAALVRPCS